jgi:hypothetical protein
MMLFTTASRHCAAQPQALTAKDLTNLLDLSGTTHQRWQLPK